MPLFWKKQEELFKITIWKAEEDVNELLAQCVLSDAERQQIDSFQSNYRKKEWLCTRIMLQQADMNLVSNTAIIYDDFGKPHLQNSSLKISVSHSKEFVALMIAETSHAGLDIEKLHPKIERTAQKFLSETEKERIPPANHLQYYHTLWGAKEVLYKIYGKGGLFFKEHLLTEPFTLQQKGILQAGIRKDDFHQLFNIHYEFVSDFVLTYCYD